MEAKQYWAASEAFDRWQQEVVNWVDKSTTVKTIGALHRLLSVTSSDLRFVIAKDNPEHPPLRTIAWDETEGKPPQYAIPLDPLPLTNDQARHFARQLHTQEFRTNDGASSPPASLRTPPGLQYLESPFVMEDIECFAAMLYEQFHDRVLDLCGALIHRVGKHDWAVSPNVPRSAILPKCFREALIESIRRPAFQSQKDDVLRRLLGEEHFSRLIQRHPEYPAMEKRLVNLLLFKDAVRRHMFHVLQRWCQAPERQLAASIVRQGDRELLKTMELTDTEFRARLIGQKHDEIRETKKPELENIAYLEALEKIQGRQNAEEERSALRTLRERIGCDRLRDELKRTAQRGSTYDLALCQRQIAQAVFREVALYHSSHTHAQGQTDERLNFPRRIAAERIGSCFGGLWLMSALLQECGIEPKELVYAKVHKLHDGVLGNHGCLLLATCYKELYLFDHGYNMCDVPFPIKSCASMKRKLEAAEILEGKRTEAVSLRMDPALVKTLKLPAAFQLMPLREGFCSNHLLSIAVNAIREDHWPEADLLLTLAASFNPRDPDILYYQGISHFKNGKLDEAERLFTRAIHVFDEHLQSHYALGELMLARGDPERAKEYFSRVSLNGNHIYGNMPFHCMAIDKMGELLGMDEKTMGGLKAVASMLLEQIKNLGRRTAQALTGGKKGAK